MPSRIDHHRARGAAFVTAALVAACLLSGEVSGQTDQVVHSATYAVFVRGARVGFESVTVTRTGGGWQISSSGQLGAPFDLTNSKFEVTYASDWQPQRLSIEGVTSGQSMSLGATFGLTTAIVDLTRGAQRGSAVHQVSARTIVLPNYFFAGYEALTARLATAAVGARYPVYVAPQSEITLTVSAIATKTLTTPSGTIEMRQFDLILARPTGAQSAEIWLDDKNHLARLTVPAEALTVIREDLAAVAIREQRITHPGDQDVFIPATGFNLAATMTRPVGVPGRLPAVVFVGGPGPQDRDETVGGVPVFGKLASALADAGLVAVRYDKRGTGQSGGRTEHATLETYTDDVIHVVTWLRRRKDIDANKIAIAGYGEGGPLALLAGGREKRLAGLALIAAPGRTGREVVLEQQRLELETLRITEAEKAARIALQRRIVDAVTIGASWDQVPAHLRVDADTPWFKSWLLFDPSAAMKKAGQPVLILHGSLDRQVPVSHAEQLETLSRARRKPPTHTRKTVVAGVDHGLQVARVTEDAAAKPQTELSPDLVSALLGWLRDTVVERK
jgi:dienelactone hydrolase